MTLKQKLIIITVCILFLFSSGCRNKSEKDSSSDILSEASGESNISSSKTETSEVSSQTSTIVPNSSKPNTSSSSAASSTPPLSRDDNEGVQKDANFGYGKYSSVKIVDKFGKWPEKKSNPYYSSSVGTWFTPYWFGEGESVQHGMWWEFFDNSNAGYRIKPTEFGYYSSGGTDYLSTTFHYLKNIGLDFILIDDTNGHFDSFAGELPLQEDAMFKISKKLGNKAVKVAFATGGIYLSNKDFTHVKKDMDAYYNNFYSLYPESYFKVDGKPLAVLFYDPSTDFTDSRFAIRYAAGHCKEQYAAFVKKGRANLGLWGWVYDLPLPKAEVMGVQPGYNRDHKLDSQYTVKRENGANYIKLWLDAVKNNPRFISIASWNDHGEETSVEAANWPTGEDDYLYQKITEGYLALKYGYIDGFLYKTEGDTKVYKYSVQSNKLHLQSSVPPASKEPVIIVPSNYFAWAGVATA